LLLFVAVVISLSLAAGRKQRGRNKIFSFKDEAASEAASYSLYNHCKIALQYRIGLRKREREREREGKIGTNQLASYSLGRETKQYRLIAGLRRANPSRR